MVNSLQVTKIFTANNAQNENVQQGSTIPGSLKINVQHESVQLESSKQAYRGMRNRKSRLDEGVE